jgi:hypothetical protein
VHRPIFQTPTWEKQRSIDITVRSNTFSTFKTHTAPSLHTQRPRFRISFQHKASRQMAEREGDGLCTNQRCQYPADFRTGSPKKQCGPSCLSRASDTPRLASSSPQNAAHASRGVAGVQDVGVCFSAVEAVTRSSLFFLFSFTRLRFLCAAIVS